MWARYRVVTTDGDGPWIVQEFPDEIHANQLYIAVADIVDFGRPSKFLRVDIEAADRPPFSYICQQVAELISERERIGTQIQRLKSFLDISAPEAVWKECKGLTVMGIYPKLAESRVKLRPKNFYDLSPQEQWDIDKRLGILDME